MFIVTFKNILAPNQEPDSEHDNHVAFDALASHFATMETTDNWLSSSTFSYTKQSSYISHIECTIEQLQVMYINFQSILNKLPSFYNILQTHDPDIVVECESWLTKDIKF